MKQRVNGVTIAYSDEGKGPAVVMLHPFPLNRRAWDEQMAALKDRFRVVAIDFRGFGESEPPGSPYSVDEMASDVRELMRSLSIDKAVLVGLSMGGYVSLAFYRQYKDAVAAMVLADTRASADLPEARSRRLESAARVEQSGTAAAVEELIPRLVGEQTLRSRLDVVERVRRLAQATSAAGFAAAQRAMADRADSTPMLSGITCPVIFVAGDQDTITPPSEAEAMQEKTPGAQLRIIQGAGHLSNMERPAIFNDALAEFLESVVARK
jgi:pimeloyl-ACP methyl ester carboxylesterase